MVAISRPITPLVAQRVSPVTKDGCEGGEYPCTPQGSACNSTARVAAEVAEGAGEVGPAGGGSDSLARMPQR